MSACMDCGGSECICRLRRALSASRAREERLRGALESIADELENDEPLDCGTAASKWAARLHARARAALSPGKDESK